MGVIGECFLTDKYDPKALLRDSKSIMRAQAMNRLPIGTINKEVI